MNDLFAALDATWPAFATHRTGPWAIREGRGGGKRVSSALALTDAAPTDIDAAEAAQLALGQPALFCLRDHEAALDLALAGRSYRFVDPVQLYAAPVAMMAAEPPVHLSTFPIWPPLAIMQEIWADGDIGPARLGVMGRVGGAKTAILGRAGDRAAGSVFVAVQGDTAMVHALHVLPALRRTGLARNLMRAAALWASAQNANTLALAVTTANVAANALYIGLGMTVVGQYHYRMK